MGGVELVGEPSELLRGLVGLVGLVGRTVLLWRRQVMAEAGYGAA